MVYLVQLVLVNLRLCRFGDGTYSISRKYAHDFVWPCFVPIYIAFTHIDQGRYLYMRVT